MPSPPLPEGIEKRIVNDLHPWHGQFKSAGCGICNEMRRAIAAELLKRAAGVYILCDKPSMAKELFAQAAALEAGEK